MGMVSPRVAPSSTGVADRAAKGPGAMLMDDFIRNFCGEAAAEGRSVEEVWKEIAGGWSRDDGGMTLEDFLARAGAVRVEDLRVAPAVRVYGVEKQVVGFGNGKGGRGRKRPLLDLVDRAALQRQRRMIKNRESAARSRERKQAYTVELETLVTQLEEENARLLKEQEEQNRQRLQQLLETVIPVTERKRPARALRRTCSMLW